MILTVFLAFAIGLSGVIADTVGPTDFESFTVGSVNNQQNWRCTGSYDQAVVTNSGAPSTFGNQSLRISNGYTSGAFGDQTFSAPLLNEAGEGAEAEPTATPGTKQPRFEAQFSLASVLSTIQTGMALSVSPDNGSGARMSYLRFEDQPDGIHVFFSEVTGTSSPANFTSVDIATLADRGAHTFKFQIDFVDGPSNDAVRIYIDNSLVRTGTSWENYYRFDPESNNPSFPTRAINCLEFREGGTAVPANLLGGFLIDNVSLSSGPAPVFDGFFPPVNNSPVLNTAKAGSSIPVKFSLGGDKGLAIFAAGYPKVQIVACDGTLPTDAIETTTAGNSSLSYDPATGQYTYVWKTDKSWKGCRQLVLNLTDGTTHSALFSFK